MGCGQSSAIQTKPTIELSKEELDRLFKTFDENGDQQVNVQEVQSLLQQQNIKLSVKMVQILIFCADKNSDGVIKRNEIKLLVHTVSDLPAMQDAFYNLVDRDGKGIDARELANMNEKLNWNVQMPPGKLNKEQFANIIVQYANQ
ncbi:Calmodulin [Hexamita inflata]|uniref:Calmodulin n=1 Tax=Hexamita inflata TaxID=28002 RepID=A0AA86R0N7_9EUKA|nr:Calmodulin [Hexamita inflata]CAI9963319.1 Calmodulin [Hexamita inflata]